MLEKMKYLYLDDNDKVTRDGDVDFINSSSSRIEIVTDYPSSWRYRSIQILAEINEIDGLILDWEFTNKSELAKVEAIQAENVDYSAESLAEHIRVSVAKDGRKDIPIIICSADKNKAFTNLRAKEQTSKYLFDLAFIKSDIFVHKVTVIEAQLFDLAFHYKQLTSNNDISIESVLAINKDQIEYLDIRFTDKLSNLLKFQTSHDIIQFLLREFIEVEGLLISEYILAARLGVDIKECNQDWIILCKKLMDDNVKYSGFLSTGWLNFWSFKLDLWWDTNFPEFELRISAAKDRVSLLNEKFGLNLIAANKIKFCASDEYWTICHGTGQPIDPIDGFRIGDENLYPWQNAKYISGYAELEQLGSNNWKINVLDREQFLKFKSLIIKSKK